MKLSDLKPDPENSREISAEALTGLGFSEKEFGDISGIVWNKRTGHLVCGHQRLKALEKQYGKKLKMKGHAIITPDGHSFAVRIVDWTGDKQRTANIAANHDGIAGDWTVNAMAQLEKIKAESAELFEGLNFEGLEERLTKLKSDLATGDEAKNQPVIDNPGAFADLPPPNDIKEKDVVVIEFSGGKDSTVAALWAVAHYKDVRLIYVDMGVEYPGFSLHVHDVAKFIGAELRVILPTQSFWDVFRVKGWPGWKGPWCHKIMHDALAQAVRDVGTPEEVLRVTGSRSKQAKRTSKKTARTPLQSDPDYEHYAPCFSYSDDAIDNALQASGVPLWDGYAKGFARTCCWCCPGQRMQVYAALKRHYPGLWRTMIKMEQRAGCEWWSPSIKKAGLADATEKGEKMLKKMGL